MKIFSKHLSTAFTCSLSVGGSFGQTPTQGIDKVVIFRFIAQDDSFYIPYQGNGNKLAKLIAAIDHCKSAITGGEAKLNVDGYCLSYGTARENLNLAAVRGNRVKSELIVRNSITEANITTTIYTTSFEGRKSVRLLGIVPTADDYPCYNLLR